LIVVVVCGSGVTPGVDEDTVGRRIMTWGLKNLLATSLGMQPVDLVGRQLSKLGIQVDMIEYCTRVCEIPKLELA
jgi:hypothetical protein